MFISTECPLFVHAGSAGSGLRLSHITLYDDAFQASLPKRIADKKAKARKAFRPLEHMGDNTTMSKGKSGKPMHRIVIEDIGSSDEEGEEDGSGSGSGRSDVGATAAAAAPAPEAALLKGSPMIAMVDGPAETPASAAPPPSSPPPTANASSAALAATAAAAAAAAADAEKDAVSVLRSTNTPSSATAEKSATDAAAAAAASSPSPKSPAKPSAAAIARKKAAAARRAAAAASRSTTSPAGKKGGLTPGRFAQEWRKWRANPTKLFAFFKTIDHTRLHKLVKSSLDADFVVDLLGLVKVSCIPEGYPVFDTLDSLSKAERFDMVIMMIEDSEASILKEAFASMRQPGSTLAGGASAEDVARLAGSYDV